MNLISNWQSLIDGFQSRLSSWKANLLSIEGRLTLIKVVLSSLGIYYLSIFKAPELILKALERYRATFFWGGSHDNKKIAWIKWSNVLSSFDKGGLNIDNLKAFNLALLQKWRWRMHSCPNSFWVKIIKFLHDKDCLIIDHIENEQWKWNWSKTNIGVRNTAYLRDLLTEISLIDINVDGDSCVWSIAKDGIFTVGATRCIIDSMLLPSLVPPTSWYKVLPHKVNFFLWILYLDRFAHRLNLSSRDEKLVMFVASFQREESLRVRHFCFSLLVALERTGRSTSRRTGRSTSRRTYRRTTCGTSWRSSGWRTSSGSLASVWFFSFIVSNLFHFLGACLGLHQNHSGVKTGGSASVSGDFSLIEKFFIPFVDLTVKASDGV
ncbi:hypothetical protein Tco_1492544 [Tanacetum coccineum]